VGYAVVSAQPRRIGRAALWWAIRLDVGFALLAFQPCIFIPQALDFGSLGAHLLVQGLDLVHQGLDDRTQGRVCDCGWVKIIRHSRSIAKNDTFSKAGCPEILRRYTFCSDVVHGPTW
jgi:hypothetical protein